MIKNSSLPLGRISLFLAILVWLALLLVDLVRIFGMINNLDSGITKEVTWILESYLYNKSIRGNIKTTVTAQDAQKGATYIK